jgi:parvulin-like peptidyl-prolyl isomerase
MAEDEGVAPKSEDVDAEIAFRTKLNPGFVNQQTSAGITLQQIKDALLVQLAQERLLTKGITVTMPEVEDYIKKNPKQFEDPATAELQWVVVKDEATKAKVDQALTTGQDFQKVALTYSIDPNLKQNGGKFPQTRIDQMVEPIRKAVEATPTGKQTAWIKFNDGQAKFLVEKKEAAKPTTISEAQKQYVQRLRDKLKETKITVDYEPLKPMWAKTEEQLKKSATTNVSTGGGGATTGDIPAGTTGPATTGK